MSIVKATFVLALLASSSAFAAPKTITCSLASLSNPEDKVSASLDVKKIDASEYEYAESDSISVGDLAFSFQLEVQANASDYDLNITFYENNEVADEVANTGYTLRKGVSGIIGEEPIQDFDGNDILSFTCSAE